MTNNDYIQTHKAYRPRSITEARLAMSASENDVFDILLTYINRDDDLPENLYYELNTQTSHLQKAVKPLKKIAKSSSMFNH